MDFTGVIGLVMIFGLMMFGIMSGGELSSFIDPASVAIVIGGTFGALLVAYPLSYFKDMPKHMKLIFFPPQYNPFEYISKISELAQEARKKGLLALEDKANGIEDVFLKDSIMLIVDSLEAEKVREMLETNLSNIDDRHSKARDLYTKGASLAPAFGMIGTLIGLINMLASMSANPDGLAAGMSVALITTLYGSMLANIFFMPFANKLKVRHEDEMLCKLIIVEGIISIQAGENPKNIVEKLLTFLPEGKRASYTDSEGA